MTITIDLPSEVEEKIRKQASNDGLEVKYYIKTLIKEASERRERIMKGSEKSFAEILAPIHKEFEESGLSKDELNEFVDDLREKVWQEKLAKEHEQN